MKNKTAIGIVASILTLLGAGCATTQDSAHTPEATAQAQAQDRPVTRPFSGVGSYGGYVYRRYE